MLPLIAALLLSVSLHAASLKDALTFHASFDGKTDAAFALGDPRIHSALNYKAQKEAKPGLDSPDIEPAKGEGRFGDALRFKQKNTRAIFYQAAKNIAFDPKNWSGTVSFWLRLDPDADLAPGFCDPIQVTDKAYNDSAIWVDFTKDEKPRHFRLGVFGELKVWNPKDTPADKNPDFNNRLVVVQKPPFTRAKWTHVVVTYQSLGSGNGWAKLYLDGALQGTAQSIRETFAWDPAMGALRLGVAYVGLFDELAVFNRPLDDKEVKRLHGLKKGVSELHRGAGR
ncbi:MAG: LamG domain-containing protein [Bryobacterales bacterium]|nr:LamG domain-containing protein [Bryobacterales bacterium]